MMHSPRRAAALVSLILAIVWVVPADVAQARSLLGRVQHLISAVVEPTPPRTTVTTPTEAAGRWPQAWPAPHGQTIHFRHSHDKGRVGDRLTALRLTGRGYQKLPSKYDGLHGIDGVYVKRDAAGEILEIRLVETKVDSARLHPGPPPQMSDAWLRAVCAKMQDQGAPVADTARLVLAHIDSPKLKRELWHHDLARGDTRVRPVARDGQPQAVSETWSDQLIPNELARQCRQELLVCD